MQDERERERERIHDTRVPKSDVNNAADTSMTQGNSILAVLAIVENWTFSCWEKYNFIEDVVLSN